LFVAAAAELRCYGQSWAMTAAVTVVLWSHRGLPSTLVSHSALNAQEFIGTSSCCVTLIVCVVFAMRLLCVTANAGYVYKTWDKKTIKHI